MSIVYEDDWVTLIHGDWRRFDIAATARQPVDAIITDPPYNETSLEWDRWPDDWPALAATISRAMWCFGSMRMFLDRRDEFSDWMFSQEIVWEKHNGSSLANDRFRRVHELATLWYQGDWATIHHQTPTTPDATPRAVRRKAKPSQHQGEQGPSFYVSEDGGPRLMRSVQFVRSEHGRAIQTTQKPEGIIAPLVEYSVPRGGLVVDLFGGSATTAVVARRMARRCLVFEARESAARKAAERLAQQTFVFEDGAA